MADRKQLKLPQASVDKWNNWRKQPRTEAIDLSGANLKGADLIGADLSFANLSDTTLTEANLRGANLSFTMLVRADLGRANLIRADLTGAGLLEVNLNSANLSMAKLSGADLIRALLIRADLTRADLTGANFTGAILGEAILTEADLHGANLSKATFNQTILSDLDLRVVKGLETISHGRPSIIATSTLERSKGDIPEIFLKGAGLSDTLITYARSLVSSPIEYYTCFISYTQKDQAFAERLYSDLQNKGVRCWYAPKVLKPGDYYRHRIDESIRVYDKLLVVLSEESIKSAEVEKEVQKAEEREESMSMDSQVLFPIRLDDAVMQTQRKWVRDLRYHRHIGDFTKWKDHDHYQQAFQQLLDDIKHPKPRQRHQAD